MVTIFTPVYNRAYIIQNLFESLKRQTDKSFEWIIVDDGSTDHLTDLVERWKKERLDFPIRYHYTENGGKHRAINLGVQMASYEAFFIVDSDDFLSDDAVEFVNEQFKHIADDPAFAGISGVRASYLHKDIIGQNVETTVDATNLERERYGLLGDKAEVYKTSVLKQYPFPEFEHENFLSETIVWNRIALDGMKIRWFNKAIYYCEYLKDGLTQNMLDILKKNPLGWAEMIKGNKKCLGKDSARVWKELYRYYENLHQMMDRERMCQVLEITAEEYQGLKNKWQSIVAKLGNIIAENNISTIAIYGMGVTGKRFVEYLKELHVEVAYGIDRNYREIDFRPMYSIEMDLPKVDCICVASKHKEEEMLKRAREKMPEAYIWSLKTVDEVL